MDVETRMMCLVGGKGNNDKGKRPPSILSRAQRRGHTDVVSFSLAV
jgi:hypothetical protein